MAGMERIGVNCVTPKPLCSLTENDYGITRKDRVSYDDRNIDEFAQIFGKPELEIELIQIPVKLSLPEYNVMLFVAVHNLLLKVLIGVSVDDAEEKAGLLHHHYPCWQA